MTGFLAATFGILFGIAFAVFIVFWEKNRQPTALWWGVASWMLLGLTIALTYKYYVLDTKVSATSDGVGSTKPSIKPFKVSIPTHILPNGGLMIRHKASGADILSPIGHAIYLKITNTQNVRAKIETYWLEVQDESGKLERLFHIDAIRGSIFFTAEEIGGLKSAHQYFARDEILDTAISGGNTIEPNETIAGWTFWDAPKFPVQASKAIKAYIKDFKGAELNEVVTDTGPTGAFFPGAGMTKIGGPYDLTHLLIDSYTNSKGRKK